MLLFRPPLDKLFDYKIFLDISFQEVLRRAAKRDVPKYGDAILDRYKQRYIPAQQILEKSSDYPANALKYRQIRGIAGRIYYQFTTNGQSRDMRPQSRG